MQQQKQAQDEQALHSTCRPSCQRQLPQTAPVRRSAPVSNEKDKISGWVGGPVCSCKNEKQTAQCKGHNLQFMTMVKADNAAVPATDSLHQNFNTAYRGSNRLSFAGQTNAATKASTGRTGIGFHMHTKLPTLIRANARINAGRANLGRNSRQVKRFGSPFQAACRRLTLSVTSLCVRKDPSLLGGSAGFKPVLTLKTPIGRSFQLVSQNNCRRSRCWLH